MYIVRLEGHQVGSYQFEKQQERLISRKAGEVV